MAPKIASKPKGKHSIDALSAPGAKLAWLTLGPVSKPLKLIVNLNCPIDILLDFAKREFLKKIEEEICDLKSLVQISSSEDGVSQQVSPLGRSGMNSPSTETLLDQGSETKLVLSKYSEILSSLAADGSILDLADQSGTCLNCFEVRVLIS